MAARNKDHDAVRAALEADGWTITDDPLTLQVGGRNVFVDLGAERSGPERVGVVIAVEVQSFVGRSPVADLQQAVGRFVMYRLLLAEQQPDRGLFLAIPEKAYDGVMSEPLGRLMLPGVALKVFVFDPDRQRVVRWTN